MSARRIGRFRFRWCRKTDRKSTRLNSSHSQISYAVFCLKKKKDVSRETRGSLLYPGSPRVVQSDYGGPVLHREVHHLHNLLPESFPEGAAQDGEVVREEI